ncbi:hypothetical protein EVG20_g6309 [Dentipellis fragilis]|uniref:Peptide hydrolase n=1 Tax=Dentipellis fragilis TaxID=205917 RepID=A0A4Y9YNS3_9AGAM|nr:hypothetical protein EVG20_g6309 [Dentipellis fragilis]
MFSDHPTATTLLLVVLYCVIYGGLYAADQVPATPDYNTRQADGIDLEEAFLDLQTIAARPHPYNSRANDRARAYILDRVYEIAKDHTHVHVEDDRQTTASFIDGTHAAYFESSNVLVKVDGLEDSNESAAILFSAHLDSVSTAPGVTDDGMATVGLVQMVSYFAEHRPRRTALFNINNGEEDGLHGSQTFIKHPWANLTAAFLNFEGAGAGGRPLLFRATPPPSDSLDLLSFFTRPHLKHPHANALTADAFARGIVRSETDFAVYSGPLPHTINYSDYTANQNDEKSDSGENRMKTRAYRGPGLGLPGADVAFYKNRARYHTPDDTIWAMGGDGEGARRSLWAVMDIMRGPGSGILNSDPKASNRSADGRVEEGEPVIYFELFASHLIVLSRSVVFKIYIALLVAGPVTLIALRFYSSNRRNITPKALSGDLVSDAAALDVANGKWSRLGHRAGRAWTRNAGHARFWLALVLAIAAQAVLVTGYVKINPYIIHSRPLPVVLSMVTLSYLTVVLPFMFSSSTAPNTQTHESLFGLYVFTWFLLLCATILVHKAGILGLYWLAVWNICAGLGLVISTGEQALERVDSSAGSVVNNTGEEPISPAEEDDHTSETTPLIARSQEHPVTAGNPDTKNEGHILWTLAEVLATVPAPVVLIGTIMFLWVGSMGQTAVDGGWVGIVYIPLALLSLFVVFPVVPFVHTLHRWLTYLLAVVFVISTVYAWLSFPFDHDGGKFKVFWGQKVELGNLTATTRRTSWLGTAPTNTYGGELRAQKAITQLTATAGYVGRVAKDLPSSWTGENMECEDGQVRPGLTTCSWAVEQAFFPNPAQPSSQAIEAQQSDDIWIRANATRLATESARFEIAGTNTRACRLYMDSRKIVRYRVLLSGAKSELDDGAWQEHEIPKGLDIKEIRLWSRTWGRRFVVEVLWDDEASSQGGAPEKKDDAMYGRIACEWAEYSGPWSKSSLDHLHRLKKQGEDDDGESEQYTDGARIPSLEESLMFMPPWATVSKADDGLVEAVAGFVL